jgi:putative membrane protein
MQQRTFLTGILSGTLLWMPAVLMAQAQGGMPMGNTPDRRPGVQDNGTMQSGPAKVDDKKFVKDAAIGGLIEVELGKLAADKGSSDAVKQFGQHVVETQTKTNEQLKDAAARAGYSIPESLDTKHHGRVDKLAKLSGAEFDKAYIKDQVKENEADVRAFQDESQGGTNSAVKAFAANTLPTLEAQLTMAKDLRKSGGGALPGDSSK